MELRRTPGGVARVPAHGVLVSFTKRSHGIPKSYTVKHYKKNLKICIGTVNIYVPGKYLAAAGDHTVRKTYLTYVCMYVGR